MIYKDKLEYKGLGEESAFHAERRQLVELGVNFISDDTKSFKENLYNFTVHVKTRNALEKIIDIKTELYVETGVML
jgi:hypothetical protein